MSIDKDSAPVCGDDVNALTRRLYAQGYTRENHPDTVRWSDWHNFSYTRETMLGFTWETPCGLLIQGRSDVGDGLANSECFYQHVWYCPENDNPLHRCPYQRKGCEHIPQGFPLPMCPCHQTDRPYDYGQSVEKLEAERTQALSRQYKELTGGAHCACVVCSDGISYECRYDVNQCIQQKCKNDVCVIRKQPRDLRQVNIFYDARRTWITRKGFLTEKKVKVVRGMKVFAHAIARTDAELWLQEKAHESGPLNSYSVIESPEKTAEHCGQGDPPHTCRRYPEYDYFELHYEVENIRIARSAKRDLAQDTLDTAGGVEVAYAADQAKADAAKKRTEKEHRKELKLRRAQRLDQPPPLVGQPEQISLF